MLHNTVYLSAYHGLTSFRNRGPRAKAALFDSSLLAVLIPRATPITVLALSDDATARLVATETAAPLPYPDALDVALVHEAVTARVNGARDSAAKPPLLWDDDLKDLAEGRAGAIVDRI
jgi:uncharacterized protein YkwD